MQLKTIGLAAAVTLLTASASMAAVATGSVNVRTGPSTSYRVLDTLRPGERVSIVGERAGWCQIDIPGPNGWVSCRYLTEARVQPRHHRYGDYGHDYYDDDHYRGGFYDEYDDYDDGPSVQFGFGGPYGSIYYNN